MSLGDLLRWVSSAGALAVMGVLLIADTPSSAEEESPDERCPDVPALESSFYYTTDCQSIPRQGHVALAWPAGHEHAPVDEAVRRSLGEGGIDVPHAQVTWDLACDPVSFTIGAEDDPFRCSAVDLPIDQEQHVDCVDVKGEMRDDCTLVVRPAEP
jgi:hypothetical protein